MANVREDKLKLALQRTEQGYSLYDHLKSVIKSVLLEPKHESYDQFENISQERKEASLALSLCLESEPNLADVATANNARNLFLKAEDEDTEPVIEEGVEHPLPNFLDTVYQFEKAGIGLCHYESTCLYLGLKLLVNSYPLKSARFWGKVLGLQKNYYVVETEFIEGEDEEAEEEDEMEQNKPSQQDQESNEIDESDEQKEVYPTSKWKPAPIVPRESTHTGANTKVYFVCQELGLPWKRLPPVTPEQIRLSRSLSCFFTGNLDATIESNPPFPGTEADYLRAKIARISATTHISPEGYYHFGEDEEEEALEEEGGERQHYVKNEEYEPLPMEQLADRSLQHWLHHVSYILPQGRVTWWDPKQSLLDEMSENEEEEEEEESPVTAKTMQPERGPPILTPIATDAPLFAYPAWSARLSSALIPEHAVAVVSSNIWPGAHSIAWENKYENIYIGWGLKAAAPGFQPYLPPNVVEEFQNLSEVTEATDPTPEEEAALRKAQQGLEEHEELGEEGQGDEADEDEESV